MEKYDSVEYCCDCVTSLATMTLTQKKSGYKYKKNVCYGCAEIVLLNPKGLILITNIDSYVNIFLTKNKIEAVLIMDGKEV